MQAISLNQIRHYINSYKFNTLVAYFCQHHWLQYTLYSIGICLGIATLTGIFGGIAKIVAIFWVKIKVGSRQK